LRQNREIGYVFGKMVRSLRSRTLHASVQKHDISNEPEPDITKKLPQMKLLILGTCGEVLRDRGNGQCQLLSTPE
jgi:hypothetical protein